MAATSAVALITRRLIKCKETLAFKRLIHSSASVFGTSVNLKPAEDGMYLQLESPLKSNPLILHSTWLRDHCRCPQCYNKITKHKLVEISTVNELNGLRPQEVKLENEQLYITWPDGHQSCYSTDWLWDSAYENYKEIRKSRKKLWSSGLIGLNVADEIVEYKDFMSSDDALKKALNGLYTYGFATITKCPTTPEETIKTAERLGPIRLGFFGEVMKFNSNMLHHKHSNMTNKLVPHTDQSYLHEPAGLKLINCLQTGGDAAVSLFDGYSAAEELKKKDPSAYETLSNVQVPWEFKSDAFHHKNYAPMFHHDYFTKELLIVRYNMYYRCALTSGNFEEMDRYYSALHAFSQLFQTPGRACRLTPVSGTVYLIDNWRIMSSIGQIGRGLNMAGCYVGWSDYMSLTRRLGIIPSPTVT
ncbi:hypothetical protein CHUAL_007655 [Chamberlinius hualienensis]